MTFAIARRRALTERRLSRRDYRLYARRWAPSRREQVLHATNDVDILLSLLAAEDEPDARRRDSEEYALHGADAEQLIE